MVRCLPIVCCHASCGCLFQQPHVYLSHPLDVVLLSFVLEGSSAISDHFQKEVIPSSCIRGGVSVGTFKILPTLYLALCPHPLEFISNQKYDLSVSSSFHIHSLHLIITPSYRRGICHCERVSQLNTTSKTLSPNWSSDLLTPTSFIITLLPGPENLGALLCERKM